jgi:hypothetical protein
MREPTLPTYPEELSQFLTAQAALMDAQPANTMCVSTDSPAITPMPPEFQLMHPRRVRCSGWYEQPTGGRAHFIGYERLTPEDEALYRLINPENGLHPDDVKAFRASIREPVMHGPVARFFARIKFWS